MKRLSLIIGRISLVIVILVPILAVFCLAVQLRDFLQDDIPFPIYMEFKTNLTLALLFGSVLFFFALLGLGQSISWGTKIISRSNLLAIGMIISLPMFCIFGFLTLSPDLLIGSAKLDNNHYYVTAINEFNDMWVDHRLHKCNKNDLDCEIIFKETFGGASIYLASFHVDNHTHEIHVFLGRWLEYTDGPYPHGYNYIWSQKIDSSQFALLTFQKNLLHEFVITKCDGEYLDDALSCMVLPFRYSTMIYDKAELVTDKNEKGIKLMIDDKLIFSYDSISHCHTEGCVITEQ